MRVGFIGLGDQGFPMAQRIARADWPLAVWARRPEVAERLAGDGATVAASPVELAACADLIGLCVVADADVVSVVDAMRPGLRAGTIVVVHSTVAPSTCIEVARTLTPLGVDVLDAPVSGGRPRAEAGTLSVMVGGDVAVFERAQPVLESFGTAQHLGPLGSGEVMKLLNNAMLMAHLLLAADAVELAGALGLDPVVAEQQLLTGSGASTAMNSRIRFRTADIDHVRKMLAKDHHLFSSLVSDAEQEPTIARLADELLARMEAGTWH